MIKFAAVASLVLIPLIWGALMVPLMDFVENIILRLNNYKKRLHNGSKTDV